MGVCVCVRACGCERDGSQALASLIKRSSVFLLIHM